MLLPGQNNPLIILESYTTGLSRPVAIVSADDARLFICEQDGRIRIIDSTGTLLSSPFLDIETKVNSQGNEQGLLGLTFHPNFGTNGYFYVNYTQNGGSTRLSRFQVDNSNPNLGLIDSEKILIEVPQPYSNHNGGDLAFGPDGYLYMTLGDGGSGNDPDKNGQELATLLGTIIRIDVDSGDPYAIPADNPFVGDSTARPEIWSWGWRNPWRFSFDRQTGDMWVADVGQNAREEISLEPAGSPGGLNFGWRCMEGTRNTGLCSALPTSEGPVFEYAHSANLGRSITGGYVYRGSEFPALQGHYVFGDYVSGRFWTLYPNGSGGYDTTDQGQLLPSVELSAFGQGVNGELYVAARSEGTIYRILAGDTQSIKDAQQTPLVLSPQPWVDVLTVQLPSEPTGPVWVKVTNLNGQTVMNEKRALQGHFSLGRGELPTGLYLLEVHSDGYSWVQKVMVGE